MSDRWSKLRDRFKAKDRDLDAEFEKFLNEVRLLASLAFVFCLQIKLAPAKHVKCFKKDQIRTGVDS